MGFAKKPSHERKDISRSSDIEYFLLSCVVIKMTIIYERYFILFIYDYLYCYIIFFNLFEISSFIPVHNALTQNL